MDQPATKHVLLVRCGMSTKYPFLKPSGLLFEYLFRFLRVDKPLGLAYLASSLMKNCIECDILDLSTCIPSKREKIFRKRAKKYDFIGFSGLTHSYPEVIKLSRIGKEINPEAKIVLGGIHVSFAYKEALQHNFVDYVIRGEGEDALPNLVLGKEKSSIDGLCYKKSEKLIFSPQTIIKNLDALALPAREKCKAIHQKYYHRFETILLGKGCVNNCSYCAIPKISPGLRLRSPNMIANEMGILSEKKTKRFFLLTPDFMAFKNYSKEVLKEIRMEKLDIEEMFIDCRVDTCDSDMLRLFKKSGGTDISLGVDSLNPRVLSYLNKTKDPLGYSIRTIKILKYCKKIGLRTNCYYLLIPKLNKTEAIKEIKLLKKYSTSVKIAALTPVPGTIEWERLKERLVDNFALFDGNAIVIKNFGISEKDMEDVMNLTKSFKETARSIYKYILGF